MAKQPRIFARDATSLVREFSVFDLFSINLYASAIGVTIAVLPSIFSSLFPAANVIWAIVIGSLVAWSSGWVFLVFSIVMPRSGGDYVYNTRLLNPLAGFLSNWLFVVNSTFLVGLFSSWIANYGLSDAFLNYGIATGNTYATKLGSLVATPTYTFIISSIWLIVLGLILLGGPRYAKRVFVIAFIPAVLSVIIAIWLFASTSNAKLISAFNNFAAPYSNHSDSYHYVINLASRLGYSSGGTNWGVTIFAAIFSSIVLYVGYQFSVYVGGEVKRARSAQPIAVISALVATVVALVVAAQVYYRAVGTTFQNSLSFVTTSYLAFREIPPE